MYALLKSSWSLYAVPCNDIASIRNFITFAAEAKLGEYELVMSSSDYVEGLHVQAKSNMYIGWQDWLTYGEHRHVAVHRHSYHAGQSIILQNNILSQRPSQQSLDEALVSLNVFYAAIEKAVETANGYGSGPYHIDNDIQTMRRRLAKQAFDKIEKSLAQHTQDVKNVKVFTDILDNLVI